MAGEDNPLKGVPLWKIAGIIGLGVALVLGGDAHMKAALADNDARDDATYASKDDLQGVNARLIRIEEKVDLIRETLAKKESK